MMALMKGRSDKLMKRRRDDIKDEASDCAAALSMLDQSAAFFYM